MELLLERVYYNGGCNGKLMQADRRMICNTIELPWRDNTRNVSCVPEGKYELVKRQSPRLGWHLHLINVPNRSLILIHPANNALKELKGCIAPVSYLTGIGMGDYSARAFTLVKAIVFPALDSGDKVYLTICSKPKN